MTLPLLARPLLSRTTAREPLLRRLRVSGDDGVQLNFGAGAIVVKHHVCERRAAEPGGVLALADVDRGPLAPVRDDHPDLLTLVKTLGCLHEASLPSCPRRPSGTFSPAGDKVEKAGSKGMGVTIAGFRRAQLAIPLLLAIAIAVGIYVFGRNHVPDYSGTALFGRTAADTLELKSWLATAILGLALLQLLSALWMYRKLPAAGRPPRRLPLVHRLFGAAALLVTLPIAYHCMFAYGVQNYDARIAVHSLAGCFFYGAFAAKVTVVRSRRFPGWILPLVGGTLVTVVAVLWYTSALWYFNDFSLPVL